MSPRPTPGEIRRGRSRASSGLAAILIAALAATSNAQEPIVLPPPPTIGGFAPPLPVVPGVRDAPSSDSIAKGVGSTTSMIEIKVGQGRFLALKEDLAEPGKPAPFIAVGDPGVVDFFQVGPRQIRLIGKSLGTTDLSITAASGRTYDFEVQVVADLDVLRAELGQKFPDASLRLSQVRSKILVEGQARSTAQVGLIVSTIDAHFRAVQAIQVAGQVADDVRRIEAAPGAQPPASEPSTNLGPAALGSQGQPTPTFNATLGGTPVSAGGPNGPTPVSPGAIATNSIATGQSPVINLIRVPTSQQVLLKVRVAELNRTAFRQIGADFLAEVPQFSTLFGSQIAGNGYGGLGVGSGTFQGTSTTPGFYNARNLNIGSQGTVFGTFSGGRFNTVITALRRNNILKVLAEPNLIALNGFQANFLAGGEFPVPSFSGVGSGATSGGGVSSTQFKKFGVQLAFLPLIQDNDTIRLTVDPEVSSVDFSVATTLVPGGSPVPGLNTRSSHTTVELKQGETLAIAGLMQLTLNGATQKIPFFGDLPYIGAFFSNTTNGRVEKELVVLVTPYIIEPMRPDQVPASPGEEVVEPNDLEFYLLNRIEGRTGIDKRSTTSYDDPLHLIRHSLVEKKYLIGPSGYSK